MAKCNSSATSKKMLAAIAFNYGDNSTEYGMAGGMRTSDRKRSERKSDVVANKAANSQKTGEGKEMAIA